MAKRSKTKAKKKIRKVVEEKFDDDDFDDDDFDDEDFEDDGPEPFADPVDDDEAQDPYWWTPHVVLGLLLLIGLLGFFGLFNPWLGFLAAKPSGDAHSAPAGTTTAVAVAPTPAPTPPPARKPPIPARPKKPVGQTYGARHLLVQYKGSTRAKPTITRSKEEARTRADEAQKKALALKKKHKEFKDMTLKFGDLAKEYSDGPSGPRGGDLGRFRKGSMIPAFQAAVEKMKVGDVSGIVETPFGFHVIFRTL